MTGPLDVHRPAPKAPTDDELIYEPSNRWVRATIGDVAVVDSRHPVLIWQPRPPIPFYAFPLGEVRSDLLSPAGGQPLARHPGATTWYDLTVDGVRMPLIAWQYDVPELAGHVAFEWFGRKGPGIEHWYEEDEEIFVHPRDPHSRVDALPSSRHVQVKIGDAVVADTRTPVVLFETGLPARYYIPPQDVDLSLFARTELHTRCPYKGEASYWSYTGEADVPQNVVWFYPEPIAAVATIKDYLCFYNEAVDIVVDGQLQERPQTPFSRQLARKH